MHDYYCEGFQYNIYLCIWDIRIDIILLLPSLSVKINNDEKLLGWSQKKEEKYIHLKFSILDLGICLSWLPRQELCITCFQLYLTWERIDKVNARSLQCSVGSCSAHTHYHYQLEILLIDIMPIAPNKPYYNYHCLNLLKKSEIHYICYHYLKRDKCSGGLRTHREPPWSHQAVVGAHCWRGKWPLPQRLRHLVTLSTIHV